MRRHLWNGRIFVGAAVIFLLGACQSGAAPSAEASPPTTDSASASNEADVAGQWLTALEAKDLETMAALFAADGIWEDGATGETFSGGPRAETSGWRVALSMVVTVKDASVLAVGDGVAVVAYTLYGPTPASDSAIDVPSIAVLRVRDMMVTRETIYYNPRLAYGST